MTLRFVRSTTRYSLYRDRNDQPVYLGHGGMQRLIHAWQLPALWAQFKNDGQYDADDNYLERDEWFEMVEPMVIEADADVCWCIDCEVLMLAGQQLGVGRDEDPMCRSCYTGSYLACEGCEYSFETNEMQPTVDDGRVCDRCADCDYYYCETCEARYNSETHHDHECGCESPEQTFSVPFAGAFLEADEEVVATLPTGTIGEDGIVAIQQLIWTASYDTLDPEERGLLYKVAQLPHVVGDEWQTRKGNFTKRLSREAYQQFGYKIKPDLLSKIGSMARDHAAIVNELTIAVTRDLNQSAEDFGNEGSCWWESYASSRCALKSNGGFGLRSFGNNHYGYPVSGRVWVMPLKIAGDESVPTFDAVGANAFVVFNGYGDLAGYTGARLMAHMAGMSYRKINFRSAPMYVNGDSGYLVGNAEIIADHTSLSFYLDEHSTLHATEAQEATCVA